MSRLNINKYERICCRICLRGYMVLPAKMVVNWVVRLEPGMVESKAAMSVALLVVQ